MEKKPHAVTRSQKYFSGVCFIHEEASFLFYQQALEKEREGQKQVVLFSNPKERESFLDHLLITVSGYVVSSVVTGVAFLETQINELFNACSSNANLVLDSMFLDYGLEENNPKIGDPGFEWQGIQMKLYHAKILHDYKGLRGSFLDKYVTFLSIAGVESKQRKNFCKSANYKNVELVYKLRNALVHGKYFEAERVFETEKNTTIGWSFDQLTKALEKKFKWSPLLGDDKPPFPYRILSADCARWADDCCWKFYKEWIKKAQIALMGKTREEIMDIHRKALEIMEKHKAEREQSREKRE